MVKGRPMVQAAIRVMGIANANSVFTLHDISELAAMPACAERSDPNWKGQKTRRKAWRRLSNAPKAVRRRTGFKERRG